MRARAREDFSILSQLGFWYWAAESIGKFAPEAQDEVPDLVAALKDESKMVRMGAACALGETGSADAAPALQKAGKDSEKEVCEAATTAL
jgi:HEAT repeat protein